MIAHQRSSETLAICQDAQSEGQDLHVVKSGGYRHSKAGQVESETQNANELIGDKISKIEENEDIPIYYSDDED